MGPLLEARQPLVRPETAIVQLLEAIISFQPISANHSAHDKLAHAFGRQPYAIQTAIRKYWLFDHLPTYAAMVDVSMSEFEKEFAERFWDELEAEAERNYKPPKKRQQEATA